MIEVIASIIFVVSAGGVLFILARKIPALVALPQNGHHGIKKHKAISELEEKIKDIAIYLQKQLFLHKILLRIKCQIVKIEARLDKILNGIRKKAQQIDREIKSKK